MERTNLHGCRMRLRGSNARCIDGEKHRNLRVKRENTARSFERRLARGVTITTLMSWDELQRPAREAVCLLFGPGRPLSRLTVARSPAHFPDTAA